MYSLIFSVSLNLPILTEKEKCNSPIPYFLVPANSDISLLSYCCLTTNSNL